MNPALLSRLFAAKQEPEPQWGPNPYAQQGYGVPGQQMAMAPHGSPGGQPLTLSQEPSDLWGQGGGASAQQEQGPEYGPEAPVDFVQPGMDELQSMPGVDSVQPSPMGQGPQVTDLDGMFGQGDPGAMESRMQSLGDAPMPPTGTMMLDRIENEPGMDSPLGVMYDPETEASMNMPMSRLPPGLREGGNIYPGDVQPPPIRGGRMTSR